MRLGKFILIVQAIITLVIGVAMLSEVLEMDNFSLENSSYADSFNLEHIQQRFYQGSYILTLVAVIEFIIIWRLLK